MIGSEQLQLVSSQSIYVSDRDRFVVMLAVGYEKTEEVRRPVDAAYYAHQLTVDSGCSGTHWLVLDRKTGRVQTLEQSEFTLDS